jgi:hypothetical protein
VAKTNKREAASDQFRPKDLTLSDVPNQVLDAIAEAHGLNLGDRQSLVAEKGYNKESILDYVSAARPNLDDEDYSRLADESMDIANSASELNNPGLFTVQEDEDVPAAVDMDIRDLNQIAKRLEGTPMEERLALSGADIAKMGDTRATTKDPVIFPDHLSDAAAPAYARKVVPGYILDKTAPPTPPADRGSDPSRRPNL